MRFELVDCVLERTDDRIVALKNVSAAEEYLADHFPGFPVLPGVFMIEALVQAARRLLGAGHERHVLGAVRALRYGSFVRPGEALLVEVMLEKRLDDGSVQFRGEGRVVRPAPAVVGAAAALAAGEPDTAVAGRFTMRPMRTAAPGPRR